MSTLKSISLREAKRYVKDNGFELVRKKGDHFIYKRGDETLTLNCKLNQMVWRRLVRTHNLKVDYEHKINGVDK